VVPHSVYPDTYSSIASSRINNIITEKLREDALHLREIEAVKGIECAFIAKTKFMEQIYGAMVIAFGKPPKRDEAFEWVYADKDGKYHRVTKTPLEFYQDSGFRADDHFSLINDPRNELNKLYTVRLLKNGTSSGIQN
jgi:bleomycin hydrolase